MTKNELLYWRDCAYLFNTGKFGVRVKLATGDEKDVRLLGTSPPKNENYSHSIRAKVKQFENDYEYKSIYPYSVVGLIARSIHDIATDELYNYNKLVDNDNSLLSTIYLHGQGILSPQFSDDGVMFVSKKELENL